MEQAKTRGLGAYVGVGVPLGVYYVYPVRVIALVSLLTLLFSVVLVAPADYLARRNLGRAWGLPAVAAGLFLALQPARCAVPLVSQARRLAGDFPALLADAQNLVGDLPFGLGSILGPMLEPNQLTELLRGLGLSAATVLDRSPHAANALSLGFVVLLTPPLPSCTRHLWSAASSPCSRRAGVGDEVWVGPCVRVSKQSLSDVR